MPLARPVRVARSSTRTSSPRSVIRSADTATCQASSKSAQCASSASTPLITLKPPPRLCAIRRPRRRDSSRLPALRRTADTTPRSRSGSPATSPTQYLAESLAFHSANRGGGDETAPDIAAVSLSSGRRVSNPRPSAWEADALPTELRPRTGLSLRPANRRPRTGRRPLAWPPRARPRPPRAAPRAALAEGSESTSPIEARRSISAPSGCGRLTPRSERISLPATIRADCSSDSGRMTRTSPVLGRLIMSLARSSSRSTSAPASSISSPVARP